MRTLKKPLWFLVSLAPLWLVAILLAACSGQSTTQKEIFNQDFNWTIIPPDGFESVSSEEWARLQNKGASAIEDTYGEEIVNQGKTIFVFKSGQLNYFESNYQPFDESVDGDHLESVKAVNEMMYGTFMSQMPNAKVDTTLSTEKIDNLDFYVTNMKITYPNNMVMKILMYNRLFEKKEFTVNITYVDEEKGEQMKSTWRNSKFGKK